MEPETIQEQLERALFFCQMFNFGYGRSGIWAINDPIADNFITFANAHLVFTMFLVDKSDQPIGGFIYPILKEAGKAHICDDIIRVLNTTIQDTTFGEYLRKWRNKLATHGSLSPDSLPATFRTLVLSDDTNDQLLELLDELRSAVTDLTQALFRELHPPCSAS